MIKYLATMEDITFSALGTETGYQCTANDGDGETTSLLTGKEVAAILFCSFDEEFSSLEEIRDIAEKVIADKVKAQIIP